jgi:hypothetical protein
MNELYIDVSNTFPNPRCWIFQLYPTESYPTNAERLSNLLGLMEEAGVFNHRDEDFQFNVKDTVQVQMADYMNSLEILFESIPSNANVQFPWM